LIWLLKGINDSLTHRRSKSSLTSHKTITQNSFSEDAELEAHLNLFREKIANLKHPRVLLPQFLFFSFLFFFSHDILFVKCTSAATCKAINDVIEFPCMLCDPHHKD
jgi:hypothetical protein